jgi:hypothetical protein
VAIAFYSLCCSLIITNISNKKKGKKRKKRKKKKKKKEKKQKENLMGARLFLQVSIKIKN